MHNPTSPQLAAVTPRLARSLPAAAAPGARPRSSGWPAASPALQSRTIRKAATELELVRRSECIHHAMLKQKWHAFACLHCSLPQLRQPSRQARLLPPTAAKLPVGSNSPMNKLVIVSSSSAPPCSQSTLASVVP